jgi:hypothetical protein
MKIKKQKKIFTLGILLITLIFFVTFTCCITKEKIGKDEAIRIALNDTRTIQEINNSEFTVSDVSTANLGIGTESTNEVYSISLNVSDVSNKQVIVFVTYDGKVALVDTPYPMIIPPDFLSNNSRSVISGQKSSEKKST